MKNSITRSVVLFACGAFVTGSGYAADVFVNTSPSGGTYDLDFNPRAGDGLLPVASLANDVTAIDIVPSACYGVPASLSEQDSMAAAAYGSDSSMDGTIHPALLGYSVEPMVEASVNSRIERASTCGLELPRLPGIDPWYALGLASASAGGNIKLRVVARAYPPELAAILDLVVEVPVRLEYALSATATGNATASALFELSLDSDVLLTREATQGGPQPSGSLSTGLLRTGATTEYLYNMRVRAAVGAAPLLYIPSGFATAAAQAVTDPFVRVDPAWPYAQYFSVEQESVLVPGTWNEVTRAWQPDPDVDGIPTSLDNCTLVANPAQLDADGDGYGNICDADLNQSNLTTATDFNLLRSVINQPATASALAAAADMNGSGLVTSADFNLLRARLNTAPGPSGLHP